MNRASFKEFRRQSPKGIVINYGVLLFKLVKSFWVLIPIFFSKNIEDKWDYIISVIGGLFLVLFVIAVVQYIYFKFKIVGDQFVLNKGMIFKKKLAIPIERIQSVNFKQNIVHQIIQVTQVEIQTAGAKDVEVSIKALSREIAEALKSKLQNRNENIEVDSLEPEVEKAKLIYSLGVIELLKVSFSENHLRSFFWILAITFSFGYQLEDIVKEWNFADEVIQFAVLNKDEITGSIFALFILLLVGVAISVIVSFFRVFLSHFDQKVEYLNEGIQVSEGLFTRREDILKIQKIQYAVQVTNPVKQLMGIGTIRIKQAGSAKVKKKKLVELVGVKKPIQDQLNSLFFDYKKHSDAVEYRPAPYYLFRMFVRSAFFVSLVNLLFYFNFFSFLVFVVMNVFLVPLTIFLVLIKYKKAYFTFQEEILIVGDGKISTLTTIMPYFKTQNILFQQSIIQKKRGVATLKFQTASGVIKLPCLRLEDALNIQQKVLIEVENSKRDWI